MSFWTPARALGARVAKALDPRNFIELLRTAIEDLRVAISKSGRTAGRTWLVLLLCIVCGMLLCALCVKWVLRGFQRLGTIIIGAVAYHIYFLRQSASRMHAAWVELSEGLSDKAWELWDQLWGTTSAERQNQYVGTYGRLWGEVLRSTPCCILRALEATAACVWLATALSAVVYVLAFRRSHPGNLAGALALLTIPPVVQERIIARAERTTRRKSDG